jgi:hypothetical protein
MEELTEDQKKKFRHLIESGNFYGFLHAPREAKLTVKTVNRSFAEFLNDLREPKRIADIFAGYDQGTEEEKKQLLIRLVLDSVLEVQNDGEFVSGVEAVRQVLSPETGTIDNGDINHKGNLAQTLSAEAIHFAFNSALIHPQDVSFYLYNFNRIPLSLNWQKRFPDEAAVAAFLGLHADGSWEGMPAWVKPQPVRIEDGGEPNQFDLYWRSWQLKARKPSKDMPSYKVYFCPTPDGLPSVFRIVRDIAADSEAHAMKIGRALTGILRADKFIVYFSDFPLALRFAEDISSKLTGFYSQGNPFSFQVEQDSGLVCMGVDPPPILGEKNSWRLYITNKIALAIQGARRTEPENPLEYLHTYMHMLGVDSHNWRPLKDDWSIDFRQKAGKHES